MVELAYEVERVISDTTSHQSMKLVEWLGGIIDMGQGVAKDTTRWQAG